MSTLFSSLQNKEFVYRGLEFEKLPAFTQRIADEFPGAQILPSNTQPDKSLRTREGQYVQVCEPSGICKSRLFVGLCKWGQTRKVTLSEIYFRRIFLSTA